MRDPAASIKKFFQKFPKEKASGPRGKIGNGKPETSGPVLAGSGDHCREHLPQAVDAVVWRLNADILGPF